MIQMHTDRNEKLIILSIDFVIIESDILNCDNTKNRTKNRKNINAYLSAKLNQYYEIFEKDNSVKNSDQNKSLEKYFYAVISDENLIKE